MVYWEKADHSWTKDSERVIHTPSQKSKELFFYLQEIGHFKAFKPYFTERENLPSYLIKFTLGGQGFLQYQGKEYHLKPGDFFWIDCQEHQLYKTVSEEPWEMVWIHFYGGQSQSLYQEYCKDKSPVFHATGQVSDNPIYRIISLLIQQQKNANARTDFHTSVAVHELLNEAILQKYQLDFAVEDIPKQVTHLKEYLDQHFKENLTLDDLEKIFHINKYQLNKQFSKYIGIPPIDYLITKKISYAKDLLRYTDASIQNISLEIGIENFAYFSRLFKNKTGMTATFYRKQG